MYNLRIPPLGAGHPDQIDQTKATVAQYKDDPRIFAWMVDDMWFPVESGEYTLT
ncbi:hypothetical protein [Cohnella sp.]|uniref:hypothetical protein n=1 Tax=Cohnella sp. TaxID=1883426 RepID=UPI0035634C55